MHQIQLPVVVVLHTVLKRLNDEQAAILRSLEALEADLVVMSELSQAILQAQFLIRNVSAVIPHGVEPVTENSTERNQMRSHLGWSGRTVLISNGLIHEGKGYEDALKALRQVARAHTEVLYVILGQPNPNSERNVGYYSYLQRLVEELGLVGQFESLLDADKEAQHPSQDDSWSAWISRFQPVDRGVQVLMINGHLPYAILTRILTAGDVFVAPYTTDSVSSSGTLSMAMACGLAPICTKFAYATWALQEDRGMLVNLQEFANLAAAFEKMLQDQNLRNLYALNAKAFANNMSWTVVARKFLAMEVRVDKRDDIPSFQNMTTHGQQKSVRKIVQRNYANFLKTITKYHPHLPGGGSKHRRPK